MCGGNERDVGPTARSAGPATRDTGRGPRLHVVVGAHHYTGAGESTQCGGERGRSRERGRATWRLVRKGVASRAQCGARQARRRARGSPTSPHHRHIVLCASRRRVRCRERVWAASRWRCGLAGRPCGRVGAGHARRGARAAAPRCRRIITRCRGHGRRDVGRFGRSRERGWAGSQRRRLATRGVGSLGPRLARSL